MQNLPSMQTFLIIMDKRAQTAIEYIFLVGAAISLVLMVFLIVRENVLQAAWDSMMKNNPLIK